MKLVTYCRDDGIEAAGVVREGKVVDVIQVAPNLPSTVRELIETTTTVAAS